MLAVIEADTRSRGAKLLAVKMPGPSDPNVAYARTRQFHAKVGFLALEGTDRWGPIRPASSWSNHYERVLVR